MPDPGVATGRQSTRDRGRSADVSPAQSDTREWTDRPERSTVIRVHIPNWLIRTDTKKALGVVIEAALQSAAAFSLFVIVPAGLVVFVLELVGVIDLPGGP
jgi:hypothetical protein